MSEQILDGEGTGVKAGVDSQHRLKTFSVTEVEDKTVNRDGRQWSLYYSVTPVGANDIFFYLKNTGSTPIAITDIRSICSAPETLIYEWVSGTPVYVGSTDVVPTPKNGGSSKEASITCKFDTNITSLTEEGVLYFDRLDTANKMYKLSTSSNIIIPQGSAFALKATTGGNTITGVVSIVEIE